MPSILFGNNTIGASQGAPGANTLRGGYFLCTSTGFIDHINLYTSVSSGYAQVAVYSVNAAKYPLALLGASDSTTPISDGWNSIALTAPVEVKSGDYYHLEFAFSAGASVHFYFAESASGQSMLSRASTAYGIIPDPYGNSMDSAGGRACSIYATGPTTTPTLTTTVIPTATSTPTWTPTPASSNETLITTFQPGHGFTQGSQGIMTDDSEDYIYGIQSLKLVSGNDSRECHVQKTSISPTLDWTGKLVKVWVKISDVGTKMDYASLMLSSDNFSKTSISFRVET